MLIEKIKVDIKTAMLSKDKDKLLFLRSIIGEIDRDGFKNTSDVNVDKILKKLKKNAIIMKNQYEIDIIDNYLPKDLTEDETKNIISKIITDNEYTIKDMGKVMKELKTNHKNISMKIASTLFKELI